VHILRGNSSNSGSRRKTERKTADRNPRGARKRRKHSGKTGQGDYGRADCAAPGWVSGVPSKSRSVTAAKQQNKVRPAVALPDAETHMANRYQILKDGSYPYFVTCTIVEWLPVFQEREYAQIILDSLQYIKIQKNTLLNAFVIMPTHLHAILWPQNNILLSDVLRDFKRFTSKSISLLATHRNEKKFLKTFMQARLENRAQNISKYQVWQEGSHPEILYTDKFAKQKLDYIHKNPIRANLVEIAEDWPYTSAGAYFSDMETYPQVDLLEVNF